jgi:hypothetical protein
MPKDYRLIPILDYAFPMTSQNERGLTKREYIAIALMPEMLRHWNAGDNKRGAQLAADAAVMAADELIKRLQVQADAFEGAE